MEAQPLVNEGLYYNQDFNHYKQIDALNSSFGKGIISSSPGEALHKQQFPEEKDAFSVGQGFHTLAQEPEKFAEQFSIKPQGMKLNTKEGIAWKQQQGNKIILSSSDSEMLTGMIASLKQHQAASLLLSRMEAFEVTAVAKYRDIMLKGRFDGLGSSIHSISDLKSTTYSVNPREFSKTIFNLGYHFQGAFYLLLAELLKINIKHFVIIAVSKQAPYPVAVYRLQNDAIAHGRKQVEKAIDIFKQCQEANHWPMFPVINEISLPKWVNTDNQE